MTSGNKTKQKKSHLKINDNYLSRILKASVFFFLIAEHKFAMQQCINDGKAFKRLVLKHLQKVAEPMRSCSFGKGAWLYTSVSSLLLLTQF